MKDMKLGKAQIIGIVGIFVICIAGSCFMMFKHSNLKDKEIPLTETEKEMQQIAEENLSDEDKEILSKDEQLALSMGDFMNKFENTLKLGKETKPEHPQTQTSVFYKELIREAESANYLDILSLIEKKATQYKFHEEYNWCIGNVYYDATLMKATLDVSEDMKGYMVKNMKDPSMLLIGTLMIPEKSRRDVIVNTDSLSPIFDGAVRIKKHEEVLVKEDEDFEDDFMNIILTETFSVNKIHKFSFEVENNPLIAYIVEHNDGTLEFITIKKDGDYECYYQTIQYWMQFDNIIFNGELSLPNEDEE